MLIYLSEGRVGERSVPPVTVLTVLACAPLFLFAAFALGGCSNNSTGGASPVSTYCTAASNYLSRCNLTDPCSIATVQQCPALAQNESAGELAAVTECLQSATCGDAGSAESEACYEQKLATLQPTATQTTLAQDVCMVCPNGQTVAGCEASFFKTSTFGPTILTVSDAIVTTIDGKCIPPLSADAGATTFSCEATFDTCAAEAILAAINEPAACTVSSADAG